jgi:hypothetical protein
MATARRRLSIAFELDGGAQPVRAGGVLAGQLVVHAQEAVTAQPVELELRLVERGRAGRVDAVEFEARSWRRGETHRLPFRFTLPGGPPSRAGRVNSAAWSLDAQAFDGRLAIRATHPVDVRPRARQLEAMGYRRGLARRRSTRPLANLDKRRPLTLPATQGAWLPLVAGLTLASTTLLFGGSTPLTAMWLIITLLFGTGAVALLAMSASAGLAALSERVLGTPEVHTTPERVAIGDSFDVSVSLRPARALREVTLRLERREQLVDQVYFCNAYAAPTTMAFALSDARAGVRVDARFTIPDDAQPTYYGDNGQNVWVLVADARALGRSWSVAVEIPVHEE